MGEIRCQIERVSQCILSIHTLYAYICLTCSNTIIKSYTFAIPCPWRHLYLLVVVEQVVRGFVIICGCSWLDAVGYEEQFIVIFVPSTHLSDASMHFPLLIEDNKCLTIIFVIYLRKYICIKCKQTFLKLNFIIFYGRLQPIK